MLTQPSPPRPAATLIVTSSMKTSLLFMGAARAGGEKSSFPPLP
jgi:hypothetical protein